MAPLTAGARVLVTGAGVTGRSVAAALTSPGVQAFVCDDNAQVLQSLRDQGTAVTDQRTAVAHIADYALVTTSPGFPPTAPVPVAAEAAGVSVWGDVEFGRLDTAGTFGRPRKWLVVTGTNGKTTTTSLLGSRVDRC